MRFISGLKLGVTVALPDANIHSPNERLLVQYVDRGIAASRELFREFAQL